MDLIIFGLLLFIVGVGSTIVYDKYKDKIIEFIKTNTTKLQRKVPTKSARINPSHQKDDIDAALKKIRSQLEKVKKKSSTTKHKKDCK